MLEKEIKSSNQIRTVLLIITITLFLVITTISFITFNYFKALNTRIAKLIEVTNYKDSHYENALTDFLNAENSFRKFIVNLDSNYYYSYVNHINSLDKKIEDIIDSYRLDTSAAPMDPSAVISFNRYLVIERKINEVQHIFPEAERKNLTYRDSIKYNKLHDDNFVAIPPDVVKSPQNQKFISKDELLQNSDDGIENEEAIKLYNQN